MSKPKVMIYWAASCGGCDETIVDLGEKILDVVAAVDIIFWPVAMDYKIHDVEQLADNEVAVTFFNGAVRSDEQAEIAHLLRRKSQLVVAFGACAHLGGIPALANQYDRETIFKAVYNDSPSTLNPEGTRPQPVSHVNGHELTLPTNFNTVYALDQIIDVDYYLPGCPPTPALVAQAITAILTGALPEKGAVLSPNKGLCDTCDRKESKPGEIKFTKFVRPFEVLDDGTCFMAQGILCMGPATRSGCENQCIKANMPCRGCFGPSDRVIDQGAKMLSAVAAAIDSNDEATIKQLADSIVDPLGTFYRFGLSHSLLRRAAKGGR